MFRPDLVDEAIAGVGRTELWHRWLPARLGGEPLAALFEPGAFPA